ncbi:diaminopimelate decarboxylase [Streptomyces sp. 846.5]|nr:type III PLP-dependent enzyme [Streptomyces sp. 846.5]TDU04451.1 diaminopimelate decarboxylase [Streptomyces sp. 846.5]
MPPVEEPEDPFPPGPPVCPPGVSTPAYVYDLAEVRRNHGRLVSTLPPGSGLFYSLKANPHPALLQTLAGLGTRAEACSSGELTAALDAGWTADEILYTGPAKSDDEVRRALNLGVRLFSVDSPVAIEQLHRLAAAHGVVAKCILRVNDDQPVPGQGLTMTGVASQFGADTSWILHEPELFSGRPHATVIGLHLYMGSNITRIEDLAGQFQQSLRTANRISERLSRCGVQISLLDLGGGFGAPFAQAGSALELGPLAPVLGGLLDEHVPGWRARSPEVVFESGRYLVATAGTLFTAVVDVKESHRRAIVLLESGINHLGGMSGLRRLPQLRPCLVTRQAAGDAVETLVAGPLCTPLDTWARNVVLPRLRPGDVLAVPNVGAYGLTASLVAFLGHPLPAEVITDSERPDVPAAVTRIELVRIPAPFPVLPAPKETAHGPEIH